MSDDSVAKLEARLMATPEYAAVVNEPENMAPRYAVADAIEPWWPLRAKHIRGSVTYKTLLQRHNGECPSGHPDDKVIDAALDDAHTIGSILDKPLEAYWGTILPYISPEFRARHAAGEVATSVVAPWGLTRGFCETISVHAYEYLADPDRFYKTFPLHHLRISFNDHVAERLFTSDTYGRVGTLALVGWGPTITGPDNKEPYNMLEHGRIQLELLLKNASMPTIEFLELRHWGLRNEDFCFFIENYQHAFPNLKLFTTGYNRDQSPSIYRGDNFAPDDSRYDRPNLPMQGLLEYYGRVPILLGPDGLYDGTGL